MRSTSASAATADQAGGGSPPFGLPVLAELPDLAGVLSDLDAADDLLLSAVARLADLLDTGEVEQRTGVGIEHWLTIVARQTRMDRRLLLRTCRLLHRLPSLHTAVRGRRVSFAQLRGLALALREVPCEVDGDLDTVLATLLDGLERLDRPDPDALVRQAADAADELSDRLERAERDATANRHLWLQPFIDESGGRFGGELDATGLALLDAATAPDAATAEACGGYGAARADTMLARWHRASPHLRRPACTRTPRAARRPAPTLHRRTGPPGSCHPSCCCGCRSRRCATRPCRPSCSPR